MLKWRWLFLHTIGHECTALQTLFYNVFSSSVWAPTISIPKVWKFHFLDDQTVSIYSLPISCVVSITQNIHTLQTVAPVTYYKSQHTIILQTMATIFPSFTHNNPSHHTPTTILLIICPQHSLQQQSPHDHHIEDLTIAWQLRPTNSSEASRG